MEIDMFLEDLDDSPNRLIGKFFTNSTPPSLEDTEYSLRQQWPEILPKNMTLHTRDNDRFLFNFKQKEDKERVLENGPWVVNGVTLVIKEFTSNVIDFTVTDLSVNVEGLPFYLHCSTGVISTIQTLISNKPIKPLESNSEYDINFRAEIDLKKPLNPGFYIDENLFVEFRYKNIGDFCYNCGMIDHVKSNCDQDFPEERALNATSKTPVYGPWLSSLTTFSYWFETDWELCKEKGEDVKECEKTLTDPQFFIQFKFNRVLICNSESTITTSLSHKFRFPCSYLDSTNLTHEVIASEVNEISSFPPNVMKGEKSAIICSFVEYLNEIRKNSTDKWLMIKFDFNYVCEVTPVDYQTVLNLVKDKNCVREIEKKMLDLVKKKLEEEDDLLCLNLWESDIRKALAEIGYSDYPYLFDVSERAREAMEEAIEMKIELSSSPIPAERQSVEKLERKKVIGSEIDELDPCVICNQKMFLAEEVIVLPCSHVFHSLCVRKWFQVGHKCPLCGFKLHLQK